jgi:ABC-type phosphate transport system substrate-binding protein
MLGAAAMIAVSSIAALAPAASATNPSGYSFDGTPHVVIGGGSDTTYKVMSSLTSLWNSSAGCEVTFPLSGTNPDTNKCLSSATPTPPYANWQHDTVVQANPAGSSNGIASLNGYDAGTGVGYAGSVNTLPSYLGSAVSGPQLDMARSSRGPKTSGGNAIGGNELAVDAFWGVAQDGVQLLTFNNRTTQVNGAGGLALTPDEVGKIYNCTYTTWNQVPSLTGHVTDGPIVVWGMNTGSGTYSTFKTWLQNTAGLGGSFDPDSAACSKKLSNNTFPLENDVKPLLNDVQTNGGGLSSDPNSTANPENWVWWGSYGLMNAFPYLASYSPPGAPVSPYSATATKINGVLPSSSNILSQTWTISRTLYHVTRKQDADCPTNGAGGCASLAGGPGGDINVVSSATSGNLGAVREFTRFLCRPSSATQANDPYTGTNEDAAVTGAISNSGFTVIKAANKTPGSRCNISSTGS